jgi:hypothetical protein
MEPVRIPEESEFYVSLPPVIQLAPFPEQMKQRNPLELTSLILGTLAIIVHWIVIFRWGYIMFVVPLTLGVLAIAFGLVPSYRLLSGKHPDPENAEKTGLAGLTLGTLTIMLATSWLVLTQTFLWGWNM